MSIPYDGSIEAEYADGYILSETEHNDVSPYNPKFNVFRAVLEKLPETKHGRMVRFSLYYKDHRYDIDWTTLPNSARPIRFKHIEQDSIGMQITETRLMRVDFGYQYTDDDGKNHQEITEL
jgi:hypothetical protein